MADIRFDCPHCQNHLVVEPEGAGLEVPCPHCGESIVIPEASTPTPVSPPAGDSTSPPPPAEQHHELPSPTPTLEPPAPKPGGSSLTSSLASSLHKQQEESHEERHSQDVNVDQPHFKKKDQWFYEKGRRYHYCYYDPHAPEMKTACEQKMIPVSADIAPTPLSKVKKSSFCKACLEALDLTVDDL